jgi:hypothetical protein
MAQARSSNPCGRGAPDCIRPGKHLRRGGIADVRIMRPDDCFALWAIEGEQRLQGFKHVAIAQIPECARAVIHDAIIEGGDRNPANGDPYVNPGVNIIAMRGSPRP